MTFFRSVEFETESGSRYRVARAYPTASLRDRDKIEPMPGDTWSDDESWEAPREDWAHIAMFDKTCCWCNATATYTMIYLGESRWEDPTCYAHMRAYGKNYDLVLSYLG